MSAVLHNKVAIVTGASSGIGKVTTLELAKAGATVVMVCREGAKAELAYNDIVKQVGKDHVELMFADVSSQQSIRQWAKLFGQTHDRLDILVNNAGIYLSKRETTVDGLERTFATNHCAYFLLTMLLLDILKASATARIVNVASAAQLWGRIDFENLQTEKGYNGMKAYSQSKLANVLFTYELAKRLQGTNVTVNCLHPGTVNTGWGKNSNGPFKVILNLIKPFLLSPEQGAKTSIYLATSPDVAHTSGQYFIKCKPVKSAQQSYDLDCAKKLWEVTEKLTGLA